MKSLRRFVLVLSALILLASACGDSETSTEAANADDATAEVSETTTTEAADDPRTEQLKAILLADEELPVTDEEADCASNRLTNELSSETIDEILADPDLEIDADARPEETAALLDILLDCIDLGRAMVDGMVADGATQEEAQCMADQFGEDQLRRVFELSQTDGDNEEAASEVFGLIFGAMANCGVDIGG